MQVSCFQLKWLIFFIASDAMLCFASRRKPVLITAQRPTCCWTLLHTNKDSSDFQLLMLPCQQGTELELGQLPRTGRWWATALCITHAYTCKCLCLIYTHTKKRITVISFSHFNKEGVIVCLLFFFLKHLNLWVLPLFSYYIVLWFYFLLHPTLGWGAVSERLCGVSCPRKTVGNTEIQEYC